MDERESHVGGCPDAAAAGAVRAARGPSGVGAETRGTERHTPDPVLELLLDPERLSGLLRTPVRATRVRPKPGVSHTAALVGADGRVLGWVQALVGPARAKAAKARDRAERYGHGALIGSLPLPQWDAELVWGGIATDPELGSPLRRSGLDLASPDLVLLRYNPLRRLVVRDGAYVVRVTAEPHAPRMSAVARSLAGRGLPVVAPVETDAGVAGRQPLRGAAPPRLRVSRRVSAWPWIEGSDLTQSDLASARAAGELAARLHSTAVAGRDGRVRGLGGTGFGPDGTAVGPDGTAVGPDGTAGDTNPAPVDVDVDVDPTPVAVDLPERGWGDLLAAARRSVTLLHAVAPEAAHQARLALAGLPQQEPRCEPSSDGHRASAHTSHHALLHGDLSLDQFLLGDDGVVRLTDLDRACRGPVQLDLASVRAAQILHEVRYRQDSSGASDVAQGDGTATWEAFVDGYGWAPLPGAWVSAALLARVAEPWRSQAPGWREQTQEVGQLALDHLGGTLLPAGPDGPRGPGALDSRGGPDGPSGLHGPSGLDGASGLGGPDSADGPGGPGGAAAPPTSRSAWRVPRQVRQHAVVESGDDGPVTVTVGRAWPAGVRDGQARVAIEGDDGRGRLRAGTVTPGGEVALLPHGEDPRLPGLAAAARTGSLLVHRAGRRAVVHRADGYLKLVRPGRAAALVEASERGTAVARGAGFAAADLISSTDDAVLARALPGIPVQRLASDASWSDVWAAWAAGWTRWQQLPATGLATHTPADEAQVLRTWAQRVGALDLLAGTPWPERLAQVATQLYRSPHVPLVVAHRDLHDGQLLWDGQRVGVVDLDTVCRAEPALDLANLSVHARLREAQGLWSAAAAALVQDAVDEVAAAGSVPTSRLAIARQATLARLVAVYCLRPRWRDVVLAWADQQWDAESRWSA
ncbi:hypothetical protein [uncultured Serinicoccus sp.]|uniref:hypothetical protein n=1 Tax=uncultured Serinicoccus sp. TaxID=735514 RepID=UPI002619696B|nr:hypothetical protein [uncultured Serinicoccus sp.]